MSAPSSSTASAVPKTPVTIHPTAHLDPGAYVRGTHAISLNPNVLIHPRAQLISLRGPLLIDTGAIIMEKAVLGGPIPTSSSSSSLSTTAASGSSTATTKQRSKISTPESSAAVDAVAEAAADDSESESDPVKTIIGSYAQIHPHAAIHAGATLGECCVVESHAVIQKDVTVGAHSKVCAGCVVDRDVGDWEVVWGNGSQRRRRIVDDGSQKAEKARLKVLHADRETTGGILKTATVRATAAKRR